MEQPVPVHRSVELARPHARELAPLPTLAIILWRLVRSPLARRIAGSPVTLGLVAGLVGPRLVRVVARQALAMAPHRGRRARAGGPTVQVRHLVRARDGVVEVGTEVTARWTD